MVIIAVTINLLKPKIKVDWTDNFSSFNDITDDVISFRIERSDLSYGLWNANVVLNNDDGQYSLNTFPPIDTEEGLHNGYRIYVNDKLRIYGRINQVVPSFSRVGDFLTLNCFGFDVEAVKLKAFPKFYHAYNSGSILNDQITQKSPSDLSGSGLTGPTTWLPIPDSSNMSMRDIFMECAENVGYISYFESLEKPAPARFFSKTDSSKQLNTILKRYLDHNKSQNNLMTGRAPREITTLKNYLMLEKPPIANARFTTNIPHDEDAWTEDYRGPVLGTPFWIPEVGTLTLDDDLNNHVAQGEFAIKCEGTYNNPPKFYLIPENSYYGQYINPDDEDVNRLSFLYKDVACFIAVTPKLELEDTSGYKINQTWSSSVTYITKTFNVGASHIGDWSGDTGSFTWDIDKIRLEDTQGSHDVADVPIIRIDKLRFYKSSGYDDTKIQDATSISTFGQAEDYLLLPPGYPFVNVYKWANQKLDMLKNPMRVLTVDAVIDPSKILEDDDVTSADFLPGWSLEVDIPHWKIEKVADGGIYWRILSTIEYFNKEFGYYVTFNLLPTTSESPEDYSRVEESRVLKLTHPDPLFGWVNSLQRMSRLKSTRNYKVRLGKEN